MNDVDSATGSSEFAITTVVPSAQTAVTPKAPSSVPHLLLVAAAAVLVLLHAAYGPIRDIDLYWHLLVGQDFLRGIPVPEAARGWSFAPVPDTWVSTQWLAEILFARLEQFGGLESLLYYRVLTTALAMACLAFVTLMRRPVRAGVWVFALAAIQLSMVSQERSQQISLALLPVVGWWGERLWREGRLPSGWIVLPLVVVWSNSHGGWVLLPVVLGLAGIARLLDHGIRDRAALRSWLLAAICVVAAILSPSGPVNAIAALRFSSSADLVEEWLPVRLWAWQTAPYVLLLLVVVGSWARGHAQPSRGELVLVVVLALFGFTAWRNLAPASLLLAPIVTGILARALGEPDPRPRGEPVPFARVTIGLSVAGMIAALALASHQSPVVTASVPQRLLAVVHAVPSAQRVLNTYNVSGPLLWFGGPPPHVTVGIDGRADRYGMDYTRRYMSDLLSASPGWEKLFDRLAPTCALLRTDEALSGVLVAERGWVEVGREGDYVLLRAPTTSGFPSHA